jgi:hypothetical protein
MHRVGMTLAVGAGVLGVLGAGGFAVVKSPVGYFLFEYGCGSGEERLGEALAGEAVLDGPAPEGSGGGESYQECDDDDLFVVAGRSYAYTGSRSSALAHYRDLAAASGWRAVSGDDGVGGGDCFGKPVGGTTAYLTVEGPAEGVLHVEIVADRGGGDWC